MDSQIQESDKKLLEAESWLKDIGINIESIKSEAIELGDKQANDIIANTYNKIDEVFEDVPCEIMTYEDLINKAHEQGFENTVIQELLTEDEIRIADERLQAIEDEFSRKTKLNKTDVIFLITAIALQVIRQYVIDPAIKDHRKGATGIDEKAHGKKEAGWYRVETDKILVNTVPFDVSRYGDYSTVKDFLKGHKNHRESTLGHDPILGWLYGTMNIMTGTVTNSRRMTAHVKYVEGKGNVIHSMASTPKMYLTVYDRVMHEGFDGKLALGAALVREFMHLKSDINTKHSLPLPGMSTIAPDFAETLSRYGIDTASVGTEASLSALINMLISMIHRFWKKDNEDEKLYEVRTRKVILYSNLIASASNVILVAVGTVAGVTTENPEMIKESIKKLDVGGLLITISRLFTDPRFIAKVKEEFIQNKLDEPIKEELAYLDELLAKA